MVGPRLEGDLSKLAVEGLVQIFDYIIMIPIVILSIAVLIYGLVLSLEQRRREVSIHRVIGADGKTLQGMVLLELFVMASVAWVNWLYSCIACGSNSIVSSRVYGIQNW